MFEIVTANQRSGLGTTIVATNDMAHKITEEVYTVNHISFGIEIV